VPSGLAWQVVVVDNGSSDDTRQVVESFAPALPVRWVFEAEPGLSNARNRGVQEAAGEYLVWTDDDVVVHPQWLAAYLQAFEDFADCAVFGGKVTPVLEAPTPPWFSDNRELLGFLIAERDFGEAPTPLDADQHRLPFGANFAIRSLEQRRHRYDPELGVGPGKHRSGEETQLIRAILADGGRGMWIPGAEVRHFIPAARQTEAYVLSYNRAIGETWAHLQDRGVKTPMGPGLENLSTRLWGAPLAGWLRVANHGCKYRLLRRFGPSRKWVWHLMQYGYYRGVVDHWRRARSPA
jgi:glycosyltransferase involved in cell wall biosynthesis